VSVDEVFMHYFEKMLLASGGFAPGAQTPQGLCPRTSLGDFCPSDISLPTPEKNSAGAHEPFTVSFSLRHFTSSSGAQNGASGQSNRVRLDRGAAAETV